MEINSTLISLLFCSIFDSLWLAVQSWIGLSSMDPQHMSDHFLQFTYSSGIRRARRSFLQLIWRLCVLIIYNEIKMEGIWEMSLHQLDPGQGQHLSLLVVENNKH
jgi:hypothetical protein